MIKGDLTSIESDIFERIEDKGSHFHVYTYKQVNYGVFYFASIPFYRKVLEKVEGTHRDTSIIYLSEEQCLEIHTYGQFLMKTFHEEEDLSKGGQLCPLIFIHKFFSMPLLRDKEECLHLKVALNNLMWNSEAIIKIFGFTDGFSMEDHRLIKGNRFLDLFYFHW